MSAVRELLERLGVRPSKVMGQNFLTDRNMARSLVAELGAGEGTVVEVGPGLGALTGPLLDGGRDVLAIEWDKKLAGHLAERFHGRLRVEVADAARYDARRLFPERAWQLIGNLPYKSAAPILFNLLGPVSPVGRAVVMLQQEMAARLLAAPGSPDYGVATVLLGRRWQIRRVRQVPPDVFHPRPAVESTVLDLSLRPGRGLPPCADDDFARLVRRGFSQRRKQLGKLIGMDRPAWEAVCQRLGLDAACRAEDLGVPEWVGLARALGGAPDTPAQDVDAEFFDVVDADDRVIGRESRRTVHARGLRHRSVHILIENGDGEIFLQKRSAWKDTFPGRWDSSAAGHVDAGEDHGAAAAREVVEELGVAVPLDPVGRIAACERTGNEFVHVYHGRHDGAGFRLPPGEIEAGAFFPKPLLADWITRDPDAFAPGFLAVWELLSRDGRPPGI